VCSISLDAFQSAKLVRAPASAALMLVSLLWDEWSLLLLPSLTFKFLPAAGFARIGGVGPKDADVITSTRAGYFRNNGWAPTVRGTAKNPNDHPHGGRTRAIRYQRTP
jgi:large subunit ribosomal protein L2